MASPAGFHDVYATSGLPLQERDLIAAAGCTAPPAIPANATFRQLTSLQNQVETSLDGCAARIEALNHLQASLSSRISSGALRIAAEQVVLAGLARDLYRQPQSPLVALTSSRSLGDFFTQWSDMQSAGARARTLSDQLQSDQQRLETERAEIQAAGLEELSVRSKLQSSSEQLSQLVAHLLALQPRAAPTFVVPAGPAAIIKDIEDAFNPLGQTAVQWALRVAKCESGYNPNAVNPYSGTEGLFQFMPSTWRSTPYGRDNVFDPRYNALGAAWLYQRSGPGQWQCS